MTTTDRLYALAHLALETLVAELEPIDRDDAMQALKALNELECIAPLKVLPPFPADRCRICGWPLTPHDFRECCGCAPRPAPPVRDDTGYARDAVTAVPCGMRYKGAVSGNMYTCQRPRGHEGIHGMGIGLAQETKPYKEAQ